MTDRIFEAEQVVPFARDRVFDFFSDPGNLEAITPPWLSFRIVARTTEHVQEGSEFTYKLRMRGLPITWVSRISEWVPGERFVDEQLRGPYARWHHTHTFRDAAPGTVIGDVVDYRLPLSPLGEWIAGRFVAADIGRIFAYRAERTAELLQRHDRGTGART